MDEFLQKFGKSVRKYREMYGLSQEKFAELVNVSTNTINSIENGKSFLTYQTLKSLCSALNITPPMLFNFEVKPDKPDKNLHLLITYYKKLAPAQQKQVLDILKTFK